MSTGVCETIPEGRRNIVVIGASLGGVTALQQLAAQLPARMPAAILVVLHVGSNASHLPALLGAAGPNTASHAQDGEPLRSGHIVVAPPDYHLLLNEGCVRLTGGPKENFSRPAIDPLFRSAALSYGARVIGVVLTGTLDDGTAGLSAIKACGGLAIVQDPAGAFAPEMPQSALDCVAVDYCLPLQQLGHKLCELVTQIAPPLEIPIDIRHEHAPQTGTVNAMEDLKSIAVPSTIVCPECGGGLWQLNDKRPPRYRCHTGHAYSLRSLEHAMNQGTEAAIWSAVRALQERAVIRRQMADSHRSAQQIPTAIAFDRQAEIDEKHAASLRELVEGPKQTAD